MRYNNISTEINGTNIAIYYNVIIYSSPFEHAFSNINSFQDIIVKFYVTVDTTLI